MDVGRLSTLLETNSLGYHLAVDIGIAIDHFTLFGTAEIELEIVFFGETHGDFPGGLLPIGQAPRRPVGD